MDKMLEPFLQNILKYLGAEDLLSVDKMQSLWSEYGAIYRLRLKGNCAESVVVKCIQLKEKSAHPRGWTGDRSHQRKLRSYEVENHWYENHAGSLPDSVKVPNLLYSERMDTAQVLVLEDLSISYPELKQSCTFQEAKTVIRWLAQFHAHFLNVPTNGLWPIGTYWHLDTRPGEFEAMEEGVLKMNAEKIDKALNRAKYQTTVHGDAKVANFCFGKEGQVAAVDFQYVGGGVGVKDVAYFIGSCFTGEECQVYEEAVLDYYFEQLLKSTIGLNNTESAALEKEWRDLYPVAWADFNRFLLGWLPNHQKLHGHAMSKNDEAYSYLAGL